MSAPASGVDRTIMITAAVPGRTYAMMMLAVSVC